LARLHLIVWEGIVGILPPAIGFVDCGRLKRS
jgi:hypothetical protein